MLQMMQCRAWVCRVGVWKTGAISCWNGGGGG